MLIGGGRGAAVGGAPRLSRAMVWVAGACVGLVLLLVAASSDGTDVAEPVLLMLPVGVACATSFALGRRSAEDQVALGYRSTVDAELHLELARSRRHERPLAVVKVEAKGEGAADQLRSTLRTTDRLVVDGDLYVLMPETTRAQAAVWLARSEDVLTGLGPVDVVAFPEDQLTVGGVLDALRSRQAGDRG